MILKCLTTVFISLISSQLALANSVEFKASLSPVGSFTAQTERVKGFVKKVGDKYVAENIVVDAKSLNSGMEMRDKHIKDEDRLNTEKFPEIVLVKAEGQNGKGSGVIRVKGVEVEIPKKPEVADDPKFVVKDGKLHAEFHLLLNKFPLKKLKHVGVGVKNDILVKAIIDIKN